MSTIMGFINYTIPWWSVHPSQQLAPSSRLWAQRLHYRGNSARIHRRKESRLLLRHGSFWPWVSSLTHGPMDLVLGLSSQAPSGYRLPLENHDSISTSEKCGPLFGPAMKKRTVLPPLRNEPPWKLSWISNFSWRIEKNHENNWNSGA